MKESRLEKELGDMYGSLEHKDVVVQDCEKRLIRNLKEKEMQCTSLLKKIEQLEAELRETTGKVEFLERMNDDKQGEVLKLRSTVELKKNIIDDIQK